MIDTILSLLSKEAIVLCTAMLPVLELRGAIPLGISMGMSPWHATLLGILGSTLPVPFILIFLRPILKLFYRTSFGSKIADRITNHIRRNDSKIKKYRTFGLFVFVAIPIPGTGAWTGAGIAALLEIRIRDAMLTVFFGNCVAALIMMVLSGTVVGLFSYI